MAESAMRLDIVMVLGGGTMACTLTCALMEERDCTSTFYIYKQEIGSQAAVHFRVVQLLHCYKKRSD